VSREFHALERSRTTKKATSSRESRKCDRYLQIPRVLKMRGSTNSEYLVHSTEVRSTIHRLNQASK
jgi:hypothetical protein